MLICHAGGGGAEYNYVVSYDAVTKYLGGGGGGGGGGRGEAEAFGGEPPPPPLDCPHLAIIYTTIEFVVGFCNWIDTTSTFKI